MDRRLARDGGDGVARLEHGARVGVEVEVGVRLVGVAPGDEEDLHPLGDEVLDDTAPRREVEDVVLVDRRRDEEQRDLVHLLGRRLVLDQLEHVGAEHDRAGRDREVAADLELRGVDALRQPRRRCEVGGEALRAADEVGAPLVDDRLEDRGVRPGEVRRRERVEHVACGEARLALGLPVELGVGDHAVDRVGGRQVALQHSPQQPVVLPCRVAEAAVAPGGRALGSAHGDAREVVASPAARPMTLCGRRATPPATPAIARGAMKRRVPLTAGSVRRTSSDAVAAARGPVVATAVTARRRGRGRSRRRRACPGRGSRTSA